MSKKRNVIDAINHKTPEHVPYNIELTKELENKIINEIDMNDSPFFVWAGNHIEKCGFDKGEFIEPGIYKDEYGVVWDRSGQDKDIGIIKDLILDETIIDNYEFPKANQEEFEQKSKKFLEQERDTFKFAKIGTTLFERAWSLRGLQNLFIDFAMEEDFVQALMEKITDYNLSVLDVALEHDFDGVYFGDDYGQQTGLMMSPAMWRQFIKPQLKRLFDKAVSKNLTICMHSCGNIFDILGDLIDIGLDIYQTVQPEVYDLNKLKKEFGADLSFYGAISTQRDLPYKTPDEMKKIIKDTISVLGKGGGYIVAPTHRVSQDTPAENIIAMVETLKEDW